jgi:hypothetical protein
MRLMLAVLFASVGVLACSGTVSQPGPGGTGGGSTGTIGTGTASTGTKDCGPIACQTSAQCGPGYYCYLGTPCGDPTYCQPLPAACNGTATCACLLAGAQYGIQCVTEPMGAHLVNNEGANECCP